MTTRDRPVRGLRGALPAAWIRHSRAKDAADPGRAPALMRGGAVSA